MSAEIVVNPFAKVLPKYSGEEVVGFAIRAPVRGLPLRSEVVMRDQEPDFFQVLSRIAASPEGLEVELNESHWERLERLGFFAPQEDIPTRVPYGFALDDVPWPLVPGGAGEAADQAAVVAPDLVIQAEPELPPAI